ncbi:MAG: S8 family serine peptidase [Acidobacteria bacterium]|nr:S8 family serine peptidase [Acidobacteriota bacterium]
MTRQRIPRARAVPLAIALVATLAPPASAVGADGPSSRILVRFRAGTPRAEQIRALARVNGTVLKTIPRIGYKVIRLPGAASVVPAIAALQRLRAVAVAEGDPVARATLTPDDPCFTGSCKNEVPQWNARAVNAPLGWSAFPGTFYTAVQKAALQRVKVAVIDSKIDQLHPDWAPSGGTADSRTGGQLDLEDAKDWVAAENQTGSWGWHGTWVAGTLAAGTNNGSDIAGLGYRAEIMPLTVLDGEAKGATDDIVDAVVWATAHGARVITLAIGIGGYSQALRDAITDAVASGALVVAAAGNKANSDPFYPASYPESMSVAGTDTTDGPAYCSNFNGNVSVSAPAMRIVSLDPMPGRLRVGPCGTSGATPHVAALAALLFAQDPSRTPAEVRAIIERNADDDLTYPGRDDHFGWGRLNFERALRDGVGPTAKSVRALSPQGSSNTATILATALGDRPILAAEVFVDDPGPPGTGLTMSATDGSFGDTTEALAGTWEAPPGSSTTGHRVYVRAYDGTAWGPASSTILIIDRKAPEIANLSASSSVPPLAIPSSISFDLRDDRARSLVLRIRAHNVRTGVSQILFSYDAIEQGHHLFRWLPPAAQSPGPYEIIVIAADEAANWTNASAVTLVA